jgi:hypothetical protein
MSDFVFPLSQFALACLGAMHLKVKGSSVLIHLLGSHGKGLDNPRLNTVVAELVGVLTLNVSVDAYKQDHQLHHGLRSFARAKADPDAALLHHLGFRPGTPHAVLWRRFWWTLVSPGLHGPMSMARLLGVFAAGPAWRIGAAWAFWAALLGTATMAGALLPLLLGFVLPLLVFGNIGALLELASEHRWMVGESAGRDRQALLSHARLLGAMPPQGAQVRSVLAWAGWSLHMLGAAAMRFAVVPGDLQHHDAHHLGTRPALRLDRHGWTNAAYEFSPSLWEGAHAPRRIVGSIGEAIDEWFIALAQEGTQKAAP